jgi:hypothetical protein
LIQNITLGLLQKYKELKSMKEAKKRSFKNSDEAFTYYIPDYLSSRESDIEDEVNYKPDGVMGSIIGTKLAEKFNKELNLEK